MTLKNIGTLAIAASVAISGPAFAQKSAEADAAWRMQKMDTDKNGTVSLEEFAVYRKAWVEKSGQSANMASPKSIGKTFDKMDGDGDGAVTQDEMTTFVRMQRGK